MHGKSTFVRARVVALAILAAAVAAGCTLASGREAPNPTVTTYHPDRVAVGHGTMRSYMETRNGEVTEIGVALTEGALDGLPNEHAPGGVHAEGHTTFEFVLPLPPDNPTPFQHVLVNWNPGGHEPPGIYDAAHFDFHFYVISSEERRAIDPADPEYQRKAERAPAPALIPERYVMPAPLAFARMGVHWVDTASRELKGEPFTRTFIYGSWDGRVIFAEPMVTRAFLETKPQFSAELPAPPAGRASGHYPRGYRVRWDDVSKEYRIAITGLTTR